MREVNDNARDPLPTLGAPIRQAAPAPAPVPVAPGVMRGADGRVYTTAPAPAPLVWIPTPRDEEQND